MAKKVKGSQTTKTEIRKNNISSGAVSLEMPYGLLYNEQLLCNMFFDHFFNNVNSQTGLSRSKFGTCGLLCGQITLRAKLVNNKLERRIVKKIKNFSIFL